MTLPVVDRKDSLASYSREAHRAEGIRGRVRRARERYGALSRTFALLGAGSVVLLVLVYVFAVRTRAGQAFDEAALGGLTRWVDRGAYATIEEVLDTIRLSSMFLATLAIVGVASYRKRYISALAALVVLAGSTITTELLKLALPRPDLAPTDLGPSFPSGHVTAAFAVGLAALIVAPAALRGGVAAGAAVYTAGISVGVIALDWHRPSDVIGAYLVTTAWTGLVLALIEEAARRRARSASPPSRAVLGPGVKLPLTVAIAAMGATIVSRESVLLDVIDPGTAFLVALVAVTLVGVLIMALFTSLLGRASLPVWRGRPREPRPSPEPV